MPYDDYAAHPALRPHDLMAFAASPARWRRGVGGMVPTSTAEMELGIRLHQCIAGEPLPAVADGPINQSTGKPYGKETKAHLEWLASQTAPTISTEDFRRVRAMYAAIQEHPRAREIEGRSDRWLREVVIRGRVCGVDCQCRLDALAENPLTVIDYKTCADIQRFGRDFWRFRYDMQFGMYAIMVELEFGRRPEMFAVAVESGGEHEAGVWRARPLARDAIYEQIARFRDLASDDRQWPGAVNEIAEIGSCA